MGVSTVHTIAHALTSAGSPLVVSGISNLAYSQGLNELIMGADGQVDPTFVTVGTQTPSLTMTSSAIATILTACGISGRAITNADTLTTYFQKSAEGGVRSGGSTNIKLIMSQGIIVPRTLTGSQGANATIDLEAIATYDGSNNPVLITGSQAYTPSSGVSEVFTLGPATVNGAALNGVQSVTVDFGISLIVSGGDGQVWPTFVTIGTRQPSITTTSWGPTM